MRGPSTAIHNPLDSFRSGPGPKYRHEWEHRGHGIVAIYSYGPCGELSAISREAQRLMRSRFDVGYAVTSGGISDWPADEYHAAVNYNRRTIETQTIFCVDAISGPNRRKIKASSPSKADWHVSYVADVGQDYLGDGEVNLYFTGPLEGEETWQATVETLLGEALADEPGPGRATVRDLKVQAVQQGRYWFLADLDPVVDVRRFEVTA